MTVRMISKKSGRIVWCVTFQSVDKLIIIKSHTVKYIANTAENIFRIDKALIFS